MAQPEWLTLHKIEWHGGARKMQGLEVRVLTDDPDFFKGKDERDIPNFEMNDLQNELETRIAKIDPETERRAAQTEADLLACFAKAGFAPIYSKRVPNGYWGTDPFALRSPWLEVTTRIGHFTVGWRKRVIELNWEETSFREKHTADNVTTDDVTKDADYIHAWGYEKLEAYLRKINELTSAP